MLINIQNSVMFCDKTEFYLSYPLFLAYMLYGPFKNIKHISLNVLRCCRTDIILS